MNKRVQVLIADAHFLVREGIKSLLARQKQPLFTSEAVNAINLYRVLKKQRPKLVIMDYDQSGFFTIRDALFVLKNYPQMHLLAITTSPRKKDVLRLMREGVTGILLKECPADEIADAIEHVLRGEKFFCKQVIVPIVNAQAVVQESKNCDPIQLSTREVEIIRLIARGYTTRQIADQIFLSFHTVATHRKNILKKLNVNNTAGIVCYAMENGLTLSSSSY